MQSVSDFFAGLGGWNWFILAVALFVLETVVPGVHFIWFGVAAGAVGVLALGFGLEWQWQVIAFALLAVAAVFWARLMASPSAAESDEPDLNIRGAQYAGRVVVVEDAIVGGRGKVRVGDTTWQAKGPDTPKGARVKVTGNDGTVLLVEPAD